MRPPATCPIRPAPAGRSTKKARAVSCGATRHPTPAAARMVPSASSAVEASLETRGRGGPGDLVAERRGREASELAMVTVFSAFFWVFRRRGDVRVVDWGRGWAVGGEMGLDTMQCTSKTIPFTAGGRAAYIPKQAVMITRVYWRVGAKGRLGVSVSAGAWNITASHNGVDGGVTISPTSLWRPWKCKPDLRISF